MAIQLIEKLKKICIMVGLCGIVIYLLLSTGTDKHNQCRQNELGIEATWEMEDLKEIAPKTFVYSAYLEKRMGKAFVKVVGMAPVVVKGSLPKFKCFLLYKNNENDHELNKTLLTELRVDLSPEYHKKTVAASFFLCDLIGIVNESPIMPIKLVIISPANNTVEVPVRKLESNKKKGDLAVCVRPFFGPYNDARRLAEFLAFYRVMGVKSFVFYNYETSIDVIKYLLTWSAISKENACFPIIEILPWSLPSATDVWEIGQLTAINDCLYRLASRFDYVVVVDLDEYIVPRKANDILELLEDTGSPKTGSWHFRSSYFCDNGYKSDGFRAFNNVYREQYIFPPRVRSKYIAKPNLIKEGSFHYVLTFVDRNSVVTQVKPEEALIHHYRGCRVNKPFIIDENILRFKSLLEKSPEINLINKLFG